MSEEQDRDNAVVVVDQPGSCQKSFPLVEKQDAHKGTPAPTVPSMSLEIHKDDSIHDMPSNVTRREQFETITLTSLEIEKKRGVIIPSSYPIPADVQSINSIESDTDKDTTKKVEDDSVAQDTAEKQVNNEKITDWEQNLSCNFTLDKTQVKSGYRPSVPVEGPSGINISIPRKSSRYICDTSGININISGKCSNAKSTKSISRQKVFETEKSDQEHCDKTSSDTFVIKVLKRVKNKIINTATKLRNTLHI